MKQNAKRTLAYITPGMTVLKMETEKTVMAASDAWYNKGGEGDFSYGIDNDDTWA